MGRNRFPAEVLSQSIANQAQALPPGGELIVSGNGVDYRVVKGENSVDLWNGARIGSLGPYGHVYEEPGKQGTVRYHGRAVVNVVLETHFYNPDISKLSVVRSK